MIVRLRRTGWWLLSWRPDAFASERVWHRLLVEFDHLAALAPFRLVCIERCIFCESRLLPGSEEHVLPSAIRGRMRTRSATCASCNNAFTRGDKVDDSDGDCFVIVRCALSIWTGRKAPLLRSQERSHLLRHSCKLATPYLILPTPHKFHAQVSPLSSTKPGSAKRG